MKKAYVYLIEGFEEIEATTIIDVLRRAEVNVESVSLGETKQVRGDHGIVIETDRIFSEVDVRDVDMLILPGGDLASSNLLQHTDLHHHLKEAESNGKYIAAICGATMTLGKAGLTNGKNATCYPGIEAEITGATILPENVVVDGNIITSRGPATSLPFALELSKILTEEETTLQVSKALLVV
ncbi:DJ-1/PfpI family protein [Bacillus sp. BRMEA1]|uniref:DJ-1 family glyoxalase III n=1 Tax=Neobacillus endophyticus TaxID=2738405 RepID=UPI00156782E1|nr:DJ-1 family glyoxalase III [Neobacillus endophyticus]NRD77094.1 DJ-1/PfpI family protein [Neobacillus endophyticus]